VEIAATENESSVVTLGPTDFPEIYAGRPCQITIDADTGETCADAWMLLWVRPAALTVPGEEPPVVPEEEGVMRTVAWNFPAQDEANTDRFEILRDGVKIHETTTVTDRSALIRMYYDSEYKVQACNEEGCSVTGYAMVVFEPGLARGMAASASSSETYQGITYGPENLVDGRTSSQWGSDWSLANPDEAWIKTPLNGGFQAITGYRLFFNSEARDWIFEVSADDVNWTTVDTVTDNTDTVIVVDGLSESGRYVRVTFSDRRDGWAYGYVVREFKVLLA
jgi:hypothetical protein